MKTESQSFYRRVLYTATILAMLVTSMVGACSAQTRSKGPCDLYSAGNTACVAAFSTTRALYLSYTGSLYQVTRQSDSTTMDIKVLSNGYANAAAQDTFCAGTVCSITKLYDQSARHNDLALASAGQAASGLGPNGQDLPAFADALPITAGGQKVYGVYIQTGMGYRNDVTSGIAKNGQPEGVYMVTSGVHYSTPCCFDFGNAEINNQDNGNGHMDAININCPNFNTPCGGVVGFDMENGVYGDFGTTTGIPFVTAMGSNNGQTSYTLYWGNSQSGSLSTTGPQPLPNSSYTPMQQEGAIILGIGGDNSDTSIGSFFEGVMTAGVPSSTTMDAVQANIVSVGYGGLLPYHDGFAGGTTSEWTTYGGTWSTSGNTYVNSAVDVNGDKAVTGSPAWDNYTLQGDVQITSGGGDAGLNFRVTNPASGLDSLDGYYAGVTADGNLVLGRESYGWNLLQSTPMVGGVSTKTWYHLTVQAVGCTFTVSAQPAGSTNVTWFNYTDSNCTYTAGAVGVRSFNAAAMWRNINVSTGSSFSSTYYAPFASGSTQPAGWTSYGGSFAASGENYVNSSDANGDKSLAAPTFGDFTMTGDVELTSQGGDAGFLVRATNPGDGTDNVNAYYLGISSAGFLVIGKETAGSNGGGWYQIYNQAALASSPYNTWYHLTAQVIGCQIRLTAQPVGSSTPANEVTVTDYPIRTGSDCYLSGQIGVRSFNSSAQWRYVSVVPVNLNGAHTVAPQNASGLLLDDQGSGTGSGNPIDIYQANQTAAQTWDFSNAGAVPTGYYNIAVSYGMYCMTASGSTSGSLVNLQPCNGTSAQSWEAVPSGAALAFHPANNTSLCLDVQGNGTSDYTLVQALTCTGGSNEQWSVN